MRFFVITLINMIQAVKIIGTYLATTGLIGVGVGISVVFGALIECLEIVIQKNNYSVRLF